jgi:hypothetical protein
MFYIRHNRIICNCGVRVHKGRIDRHILGLGETKETAIESVQDLPYVG